MNYFDALHPAPDEAFCSARIFSGNRKKGIPNHTCLEDISSLARWVLPTLPASNLIGQLDLYKLNISKKKGSNLWTGPWRAAGFL